ncbi:MAG: ABC transporter permease, partial [Betaproteobacteria bacterium]
MKIPFSYIFRNLWTRKLTTILTAAGMGLVVFVFSAVLMLDAGLKKTMVGTGSLDNVLAIRTGSETEIQSGITRDQAGLLGAMPQVARSKSGDPMVSKESLVLISLTKSGQEKGSNVVARGVSPMGITLRPQVKLIEGRMFRPGSSELVVGRNINREFNGAEIGQSLRFAQRDWVIVGVFDGGGSAFDSEIWGDVEQLMQAFRRLNYSSVIMQLAQQDSFESLLKEIAAEVRLTLDVKREQIFYE